MLSPGSYVNTFNVDNLTSSNLRVGDLVRCVKHSSDYLSREIFPGEILKVAHCELAFVAESFPLHPHELGLKGSSFEHEDHWVFNVGSDTDFLECLEPYDAESREQDSIKEIFQHFNSF